MKSLQIFGLLIVLAFSSAVFAQEKETEKPKEAEKAKEVQKPKTTDPHGFVFQFWVRCGGRNVSKIPNQPADVIDVELVLANPANDEKNDDLSSGKKSKNIEIIAKSNNTIEVITKAIDLDKDTLTYNYTVSGGRIIHIGEKVSWDLSGVKPGTYTITAAVDDGCGFCGKTMTKTVIVKE